MEGWITLNRSLLDHYIWQDEPFTRGQAWVDLLLLATHEPRQALIYGQVVELKVGEYVTTIRRLSERWNRSIDWVTKYLNLLQSDNMIQTRVVGKGKNSRTVLLVVKYEVYQFSANAKRTYSDQIANAKRTQDGGKGVLNNNIINTLEQQGNNETMEQITPNTLTGITPKGGESHTSFESEFEEVWKKYPKKNGKASALKDYIKARKNGVARETIETGLDKYIDECARLVREKQYIADGSTWFHQSRWDWDYDSSATPAYEKPKESFEDEYFNKIERWKKEGLWNG